MGDTIDSACGICGEPHCAHVREELAAWADERRAEAREHQEEDHAARVMRLRRNHKPVVRRGRVLA